MAEDTKINLDALVEEDTTLVKKIIASTNTLNQVPSRPLGGYVPKVSNIYTEVIENLGDGARNNQIQIEYLSAFETALGIFRQASTEIRRKMDIVSLEQRLETQEANLKERFGDAKIPQEIYLSAMTLGNEISDAVHFSNKYALAFAGKVGLAMLGSKDAMGEKIFQFEDKQRASKERDELTSVLARIAAIDFKNILSEVQERNDDVLKHTLEAIFTSWTRQLDFKTWEDVLEKRNIASLKLEYKLYSMQNGNFKEKSDTVIVDEKLMRTKKEDIIGNEDFSKALWENMLRLSAYNFEKKDNPLDPASVVFTYGAPGGGKTFMSHSLIQSFADLCKEKSIPLWAMTHSVTDYASHYQNLTANQLQELSSKINNFPGLVVMYVADADTLFKSRQDPNLTAEQQNTMGVYFKMFDGTMIAKNGRFMAIMDANYIDGIDEATKSRLFDEVLELKRYQNPNEWSEYVRRGIEGKLSRNILTQNDWLDVGNYILSTDLSAREVGHTIKKLRRSYDVTEELLNSSYDAQKEFRSNYMTSLTKDKIIHTFEDYINKRVEIERASLIAKQKASVDRFLTDLKTPHITTK